MKVIIAGSRGIVDYNLVKGAIEYGIKHLGITPTEVVSGGARGIDRLGERFAKEKGITIKQFIPDWDGEGKKAGILRNKDMGDYADALISIWDGQSRGTKQMIEYMKSLGKPVYIARTHMGGLAL
jgi:hypothetical protein